MKALILILTLLSLSFGEVVHVAVASSMRPLMEELVLLFEAKNPDVKIKLSYGSSGSIYRQILGGAPYDLFVSASESYTEKLWKERRSGKPFTFALGRLVLFSRELEVKGIESLKQAKRIAIASPKHAPYGIAAVEFLKKAGLYGEVKEKLVYGSNVAQAFQFVVSGGADLGVVALSLAKSFGEGNLWMVPRDMHNPIKHSVVVTSRGLKNRYALMFMGFLASGEARDIIREYGFEVPQ